MDEVLRCLQLTQLEMLKIFDNFCKRYNLHYSLYAGTLLGAVRHKAFIPWDDDLDVCMARDEYDRFIALWEKAPCEGYVLQNKESSPKFTQSFTKLRKDHTTFLQSKDEIGKYHTGIFIDIFPIDRIPSGKFSKAFFKWNCMKYQLLTREFVPTKGNLFVRIGSTLILASVPKKRRESVRQKLLNKITQYDANPKLETVAIEIYRTINQPLEKDLFNSYTYLEFEGEKFMCFSGWDEYLHRKFGDYMQLPPEEERVWKHHPILIDFEHNYEELSSDES